MISSVSSNIRKKRQVPPTDCAALEAQLAKARSQTIEIQKAITNATNLLNATNKKIAENEQTAATATGNMKNLCLSLIKVFNGTANSHKTRLTALNSNATRLQTQESQIQ